MDRRKYPVKAEEYQLLEEIGQGVSASVHRALCIPFDEIVVIKILDLERYNSDLSNISREAQTMILIDHPNVLKAHCSFVNDHNLWVVMPFMAGGSCLHILKAAYPDGFEEVVIATILREVLKGLEYLHHHGHIHRDVKGIPEDTEVAIPVSQLPSIQASSQGTNTITETNPAGAAPLSGLPNSSPLNMFPQGTTNLDVSGGDGSLDFLRNNIQFQTLCSLVQANPQILQPMLQELGKQNPQLMRLIQQHQSEFLQLINEPHEGAEGDLLEQAEPNMPHSISVTPEEQEAIERLEAMGFDRALVIEAFLACDRNEELAVKLST